MIKTTKNIMGMPVTVCIDSTGHEVIDSVFKYFNKIDKIFSTYKDSSESVRIQNEKLKIEESSNEMREVIRFANKMTKMTNGYFDIYFNGVFDPTGIVKGWAIEEASKLINLAGITNYYINAGGDIKAMGRNEMSELWTVGIQNPWNSSEIVKRIKISDKGIATSGTYQRGLHIINPKTQQVADQIASMSVISNSIVEADSLATAAFAMGEDGINFIESLEGIEGYMILNSRKSIQTSRFNQYIIN